MKKAQQGNLWTAARHQRNDQTTKKNKRPHDNYVTVPHQGTLKDWEILA